MKLIDLNLNVDEQIIKLIIENLADEKFNEFGLTDWKFLWGTAIKQLGLCDYNKKIIRMSLPLAVSNLKEANDTLFHELAHALTPSCGHNNEWKEACVKLGATPERLAPANITARRQHLPKQKTYKLTCPCCNFYATKSRKSSSSSSCPKCDKKYNDNFKLIWSEPTVTTTI